MLLEHAIDIRCRQRGSDEHAVEELNSVRQQLPSKLAELDGDGRIVERRLATDEWRFRVPMYRDENEQLRLDHGWRDGIEIFLRGEPGFEPTTAYEVYEAVPGRRVFIWKPKFKKIFGGGDTPSEVVAVTQESSGKPGAKRKFDEPAIRAEIVRRCWRNGRFIAPKSVHSLAKNLCDWCQDTHKKEPSPSWMREFAGGVIAVLKLVAR